MSNSSEQFQALYEAFKERYADEMQAGDEQDKRDMFIICFRDILVFEMQSVTTLAADAVVEEIIDGSRTLTQDEWEAMASFLKNIDWETSE